MTTPGPRAVYSTASNFVSKTCAVCMLVMQLMGYLIVDVFQGLKAVKFGDHPSPFR
jgi:hypothetical protein